MERGYVLSEDSYEIALFQSARWDALSLALWFFFSFREKQKASVFVVFIKCPF